MVKKKIQFNMGLVIVFVLLSVFDLLANAGSIIIPIFGGLTETVQEFVNETIQILILTYFFAITKKK